MALRSVRKRIELADEEASLSLEGLSRRLVRLGLVSFGHAGGSGTGVFDDAFRAALRSWQESRKLGSTGWLTRRQAETLIAEGRAVEAEGEVFEKRVGRTYSAQAKDERTGWTDLHYAAAFDLPRAASALVAAGLEVDTRLMDDDPPFGKGLKATLAGAGRGNLFDNWVASGETPLMIAAYANAQTAAKALVQKGADIDARIPKGGHTPLYFAAAGNALEVMKLLIGHGADIFARPKHYEPMWFVLDKEYQLDLLEFLVGRSVDIDANKELSADMLEIAARENQLDLVKKLIGQSAEINMKERRLTTLLRHAAKGNALRVVKWAVRQGADITRRAVTHGRTPLHAAAARNAVEVTKWLVEQGADVNAKSNNGWTLLLAAAGAGNKGADVARWLVGQGADINAKSNNGRTPLHAAAWLPGQDLAIWLIRQGADIYAKQNNGWTVLHEAAKENALELAKSLVRRGVDVNVKDNDGVTPLHTAARAAQETAIWLVQQGADIKMKDNDGETPLHKAAVFNSLELTKLLIRQGADVNAMAKNGQTPLHWAKREAAELLVRHGADINAKDKDGQTPLHMTVESGGGSSGIAGPEWCRHQRQGSGGEHTAGQSPSVQGPDVCGSALEEPGRPMREELLTRWRHNPDPQSLRLAQSTGPVTAARSGRRGSRSPQARLGTLSAGRPRSPLPTECA